MVLSLRPPNALRSAKNQHCTGGRDSRMGRMNGNRLSERLRESIEEEIATGKLLPGTRLDEVELATRFGVSRTPIREALRLLLGEGLVETRPQRLRVRNRPQRSFEEHQAIVDALREGDADKAVQAIRSHVVVQGERFGDLIASLGRMTA